METYEVPAGLLEAIAQYLVRRPHVEVDRMIQGLRQCKPIDPDADHRPAGYTPAAD